MSLHTLVGIWVKLEGSGEIICVCAGSMGWGRE
jgi:hypothetical protein